MTNAKEKLDSLTEQAYLIAGAAVADESFGRRIDHLEVHKTRSGYRSSFRREDWRRGSSAPSVVKTFRFAGAMTVLARIDKIKPARREFTFEEVCRQANYAAKRVPHALGAYERALEAMNKHYLAVDMVALLDAGLNVTG